MLCVCLQQFWAQLRNIYMRSASCQRSHFTWNETHSFIHKNSSTFFSNEIIKINILFEISIDYFSRATFLNKQKNPLCVGIWSVALFENILYVDTTNEARMFFLPFTIKFVSWKIIHLKNVCVFLHRTNSGRFSKPWTNKLWGREW